MPLKGQNAGSTLASSSPRATERAGRRGLGSTLTKAAALWQPRYSALLSGWELTIRVRWALVHNERLLQVWLNTMDKGNKNYIKMFLLVSPYC